MWRRYRMGLDRRLLRRNRRERTGFPERVGYRCIRKLTPPVEDERPIRGLRLQHCPAGISRDSCSANSFDVVVSGTHSE